MRSLKEEDRRGKNRLFDKANRVQSRKQVLPKKTRREEKSKGACSFFITLKKRMARNQITKSLQQADEHIENDKQK